jgi:hypothetical protein
MVSTALRVTETVGSCRVQYDETSTTLMRMAVMKPVTRTMASKTTSVRGDSDGNAETDDE